MEQQTNNVTTIEMGGIMLSNQQYTRARGRPKGALTPPRSAVLRELLLAAYGGARDMTLTDLAERAGLYDYRIARRVVKDLRQYGWI